MSGQAGLDGRIPLAVIGIGRVARAIHLPLLAGMTNLYEVVALADQDQARASSAAAGLPGARPVRNLSEAYAAGARAVLCTTPWPTHAELVAECLVAGVPVLCEKPLDLAVENIESLRNLERESTATVSVGYMKRHDPAVVRLIAQTREQLHRVRLIEVRVTDPNARYQLSHLLPDVEVTDSAASPSARRALDRILGRDVEPARRATFAHALGGSLIHHINLVHALVGDGYDLLGNLTHAVFGAGGATVTCGWRLRSDLLVTMTYLMIDGHRRYTETVEVLGETDRLRLSMRSPYLRESTGVLTVRSWDPNQATVDRRYTASPGATGFAQQLRGWAAHLRGGPRLLPDLTEALRDCLVVHEAYAALS